MIAAITLSAMLNLSLGLVLWTAITQRDAYKKAYDFWQKQSQAWRESSDRWMDFTGRTIAAGGAEMIKLRAESDTLRLQVAQLEARGLTLENPKEYPDELMKMTRERDEARRECNAVWGRLSIARGGLEPGVLEMRLTSYSPPEWLDTDSAKRIMDEHWESSE